ncbi:hypothetical protein HYT84_00215 [Candidatus Micrarchaeota archaeon]|nr:hypothetical protein [Candidatus Micrarchaeota archaeon]
MRLRFKSHGDSANQITVRTPREFFKWKDKRYDRLVEKRKKLERELGVRTDRLDAIRKTLNNQENPVTKGTISRKEVGLQMSGEFAAFSFISTLFSLVIGSAFPVPVTMVIGGHSPFRLLF